MRPPDLAVTARPARPAGGGFHANWPARHAARAAATDRFATGPAGPRRPPCPIPPGGWPGCGRVAGRGFGGAGGHRRPPCPILPGGWPGCGRVAGWGFGGAGGHRRPPCPILPGGWPGCGRVAGRGFGGAGGHRRPPCPIPPGGWPGCGRVAGWGFGGAGGGLAQWVGAGAVPVSVAAPVSGRFDCVLPRSGWRYDDGGGFAAGGGLPPPARRRVRRPGCGRVSAAAWPDSHHRR